MRRLRHGPIRDQVLEVRFVTGDGRVVKGGGPTVKNVTGYDLPRLMVGSLGTLGVLAQVTLRCRPRAAGREVVRGVRTADARLPARGDVVERSGASSCAAKATRPTSTRRVRARRVRNAPALPEGAHRGRISVAPGAIAGARRRPRPTSRWCAELGVGTVHVAADSAGALDGARAPPHTRTAAGCSAKPAATAWTRSAGELPNRALMQRIKSAFDPTGKLAPGRLPL